MRILVTGASGFAGSLLVPRLCGDGHAIRAFGRDPERVRRALARTRAAAAPAVEPAVEVMTGDVLTGDGLARALDGVQVAYYLIHSMERTPAGGAQVKFVERERVAAQTFARAAADAGVRRIVYLGGLPGRSCASNAHDDTALQRQVSSHLSSRAEVQSILLGAVADSLALRASIVIGARSRSFRLLVHLVERMRVLALPAWHAYRTQPIDERDVTEMLAACATTHLSGCSLDIGGPDVLSYGEMLTSIAQIMLVGRPSVRLGVNLTAVTARVAAAIAGEDPELVVALMEGLQGDLLPADDHAAQLLGVTLHSFESAVEHALGQWEASERLAAR
jgi:uncharacterized protein YbjT (DUF2867 family)